MRLNYFILILNLQSKHQMVKTDIFSIPAGILQGDTLAPFLFIIVIDLFMRVSVDKNLKCGFLLERRLGPRNPATYIHVQYKDIVEIHSNSTQIPNGSGVCKWPSEKRVS